MNLNREPSDIAKAAAEEVRTFNHRTIDAKIFQEPIEIHATVSGLAQLVQGLPQAIEQAWKGLRVMEQADAIRMDNGSDGAAEMEDVRRELGEARRLLASAGDFLNRAAQPLSHMGGQWEAE